MEASELNLERAPNWSLMVGQAGSAFVWLSVGLFVLSAALWVVSTKQQSLSRWASVAFGGGCASVLGAIISLGVLFANNRFEFEYVWAHSDLKNTLAYRIAGIWSGQEGSFLLWASATATFAWLASRKLTLLRRWYEVACSIFLAGIMGILAFETPFKTILFEGVAVVPPDGRGLAPSLQNYWVIIHPPTIFVGFGLLTVPFAMAFAALLIRDHDEWLKQARSWSIGSLAILGLGLCMGGFWAYETLGWGGFWMWDPVENVSFVPWCLMAACVHGMIVQSAKGKWKFTNLLLAGLPFLSFVYGTFLTRSGFLSSASVHSFAEMDRTALKLLIGILTITTLGFLSAWTTQVVRHRKMQSPQSVTEKGIRREVFYGYGAMFLIGMAIATLIGMSVPFFMALRGEAPRIVEERTYHLVLPWLFVPLMVLMAIAPFVGWKTMGAKELTNRIYSILCITVGITGVFLITLVRSPLSKQAELTGKTKFLFNIEVPTLGWVVFLTALCIFVLVSSFWRMVELKKAMKLGWGSFVSHAGVAVLMAGLILSRGFERKVETLVFEDAPGRFQNYNIRFDGMTKDTTDRTNEVKLAFFDAHKGGDVAFTAMPGLYFIEGEDGTKNPMVWPHIERYPFHDVYVTLHPPQTDLSDQMTLTQGQSSTLAGWKVTYEKFTREGNAGAAGTQFGAQLKVVTPERTFTVTPKMALGENGPEMMPAQVDDRMQITMVSMDAEQKSVVLQLQLTKPMYPIEIFVKPFTIFVWLGTGLMTLGGLMAAAYRRVRVAPISEPVKSGTDSDSARTAIYST